MLVTSASNGNIHDTHQDSRKYYNSCWNILQPSWWFHSAPPKPNPSYRLLFFHCRLSFFLTNQGLLALAFYPMHCSLICVTWGISLSQHEDCSDFLRFFFQDKISGLRGNITPLDNPFNYDLPHSVIMEFFHPVSLLFSLPTQVKPSTSPADVLLYFVKNFISLAPLWSCW